ncbi:unnamed protein product [Mytilus edulis]|uniref:Reverse transcriptase RNase H-like domain-containing protein n=1 Tax=Mytilus edulis TaxID=6550 RepID=A0A8S3S9I9_MYTED|nr:unnamed protein product [Mytilus edulis]
MTIPAHTEMIVNATIQGDSSHIMDAIVEPVMSNHTSNLLIAKALVDPSQGHVPLRIANLTDEVQTVFKSTCTAVCESVDMTQRYEDTCKVSQMITKENSEDIPLYLQDMFERSSSNLSESQVDELKQVLVRHKGTFSKTKDDLGRATAIRHKINTGTATPVKLQPRRLPFHKREEADKEPERQYCVTRRELLAIVSAIRNFHHYLYGSPFLVRTDHGALNWLLRFKNPEGQMARWLEVLNTYNFEVQHRPGRLHGNADGLSRRPCYPCSHCNKQDQKEFTNTELEGCIRMAKTNDDIEDQNTEDETQWIQQKTTEEIIQAQKSDEILGKLYQMKTESKDKPKWGDIAIQNPIIKRYWSQWDRIVFENGVLNRQWLDTITNVTVNQLLVPSCWTKDILQLLHNNPTSGHLGIHKTVARDWDEQLPWAFMAYRSSVHESTKFSPCKLMLGREIELPIDIIYGSHPQHEEFRENQKKQYDIKSYQHSYQKGNVVWLYTPTRVKNISPKLQRKWDGPYFIVTVLSDVTYKIQKNPSSRSQVVHHDRLKPYYGEVNNWVI